ncbi:hypothetical protein Sango_2054200 [Sesamum angolense]|uniref:Uncharacterized protein n=1 Tax=Sesamum angolense TaxID=2727404 RepID=A0AAE2BPE5_9LAMI|nr:hypothetical protein Sango_2054200 [Sesamum angolense]
MYDKNSSEKGRNGEISRLNMEEYVDDYFEKDAYLRVYGHMINHVPGMHDYEESPLGIVEPPQVKSKPGRPKKVRRRDANDIRDGVVSRKGLSHTCANCLRTGHNKRSCTNLTPNSKNTQNNSAGPSNIRNEQVDLKLRLKLKRFHNFQMIMHFKYQTSLLKQEVIRCPRICFRLKATMLKSCHRDLSPYCLSRHLQPEK